MNQKLKSQTSERVLKTFNNDVYDDFLDDEYIVNQDAKTVEFLFLGNSLTYTGVPDEEPDKTKRGLTSTRSKMTMFINLFLCMQTNMKST